MKCLVILLLLAASACAQTVVDVLVQFPRSDAEGSSGISTTLVVAMEGDEPVTVEVGSFCFEDGSPEVIQQQMAYGVSGCVESADLTARVTAATECGDAEAIPLGEAATSALLECGVFPSLGQTTMTRVVIDIGGE